MYSDDRVFESVMVGHLKWMMASHNVDETTYYQKLFLLLPCTKENSLRGGGG